VKALIVLAQPPHPQGGAAGRCAWALLQGLHAHGVDVQAIAARRASAAAPPPAIPVRIDVVDVESRGSSLRERVSRLRRPRNELAGAFAARVQAAAAGADVVHLDEFESTWCAVPGVPNVLHVHYLIDQDRNPGAPWTRTFFRYVEERLAQRRALARHSNLIANSPRVADLLRARAPHARISVIPLALDPDQYTRAALDGEPVAGLIGTLDWPPTSDAVRHLLRESWPAVRREVSDARLVIAGRGTESLVVPAGAEALGPVSSSADFFGQLSLLLYPVARGSGMKVKVLEAMASGVPVVTTRVGAEGIAPNDGVVVADDPAQLARAASRILLDGSERTERGTAGLACFTQRYAPGPATEPLVPVYEAMADAQTASSSA
jgi:glycosyltransferase involved in cell wall biosynthesis